MGCWDGTLLTLTGKEVAWSAVQGTSACEDGDAIQLATTQAMSMSVSIAHHCKSCHQMLCPGLHRRFPSHRLSDLELQCLKTWSVAL